MAVLTQMHVPAETQKAGHMVTELIGSYELPDMGVENSTQVL